MTSIFFTAAIADPADPADPSFFFSSEPAPYCCTNRSPPPPSAANPAPPRPATSRARPPAGFGATLGPRWTLPYMFW